MEDTENNKNKKVESVKIFLTSAVVSSIHNEWILEKNKQNDVAKIFKARLQQISDDKYYSQQINKLNTITQILQGTQFSVALERGLEVPFADGKSYLAKLIYLMSMFKACIEYDVDSINLQYPITYSTINKKEDYIKKIDLIMKKIDEELNSHSFNTSLQNENPNILDSLEKINGYNSVIIPRKKPRYIAWGFVVTLITGTSVGLFVYFGKKI